MRGKRFSRGWLAAAGGIAAVAALAGCSQTAQLQPVAGDAVTAVNNAVSDVVAQAGVQVMTWPTCAFANKIYTCTGTTTTGQKISGITGSTEPLSLTVTVGDRKLYQGTVQDVIEQSGRSR